MAKQPTRFTFIMPLWESSISLLLLGSSLTACQPAKAPESRAADRTASESQRSVNAARFANVGPLDLGGRTLDGDYAEDPLWRAALDGDPLHQRRLANREGAARLLEIVKAGGRAGAIALSALRYCEDAREQLGATCALAPRLAAEDLTQLLETLHHIAMEAPHSEAHFDQRAERDCAVLLRDLSGASELSPSQRDLAASAERFLDEDSAKTPWK